MLQENEKKQLLVSTSPSDSWNIVAFGCTYDSYEPSV
uniref:Protein kinase domain-containing protein n=1 Tax=Heterorhabditis bacteriophora TaxID=37862 RepID=A0A1I7X812_HETBA